MLAPVASEGLKKEVVISEKPASKPASSQHKSSGKVVATLSKESVGKVSLKEELNDRVASITEVEDVGEAEPVVVAEVIRPPQPSAP